MKKPLILINFKTYEQTTGKKALKLAKAIDKFGSKKSRSAEKYQLAVSPQLVDLKEIKKTIRIPVFAQHLDNIDHGSHTGSVLPEAVKAAGATGTILNHSEKKIKLPKLKETLGICKQLNLKTIICTGSLAGVKKLIKLQPNYIAYEPKKLIGKNVSVTQTNPKIILKAVKLIEKKNSKTKLLVGAGIHSKQDVKKAIGLGADGVLLAHKVVKAKNTKKVLQQMFD
tara:strand:- start:2031 stop:2708 length:678 start_codon:yes stop_codon:yes gene_type:complete